jgi:putative ABC transport system substrate-binding protein
MQPGRITRRQLIAILGGAAAAWPVAARARERDRLRRVGLMMGAFTEMVREGQRVPAAFLDAMERLGWTLGRNLEVNTRWPTDDAERGAAARDLVAWTPDLLFCCSRLAADLLSQATRTVPIVLAERGGPDRPDRLGLIPRAALRVDRILRGEIMAAGTPGRIVPPNLFAIADEMID